MGADGVARAGRYSFLHRFEPSQPRVEVSFKTEVAASSGSAPHVLGNTHSSLAINAVLHVQLIGPASVRARRLFGPRRCEPVRMTKSYSLEVVGT